jgi:hypothetical protein
MNLYDYWFHQNFFSLKEIKKINKTILENKDPNQIDFPAEHITKINEVTICKYFYLKNIFCKFRNYIEFINNTYFGYDIFNEQDNDNIHYNVYDFKKQSRYDYHTDGTFPKEIFDMKLTCLINTSEKPYEGGKFYINKGKEINIKEFDSPGSIIIFPSIFLHKISPVTKGIRSSVTYWIHGPKWR